MRYYIDGKEVTKEITEETKQVGDLAALKKIQFITEVLPC